MSKPIISDGERIYDTNEDGSLIPIPKLKTLKDIPGLNISNNSKLILNISLRVEAIKWIKEIRKHPKGTASLFSKGFIVNEDKCPYNINLIEEYIKHFFNIQESDLAEGKSTSTEAIKWMERKSESLDEEMLKTFIKQAGSEIAKKIDKEVLDSLAEDKEEKQ